MAAVGIYYPIWDPHTDDSIDTPAASDCVSMSKNQTSGRPVVGVGSLTLKSLASLHAGRRAGDPHGEQYSGGGQLGGDRLLATMEFKQGIPEPSSSSLEV